MKQEKPTAPIQPPYPRLGEIYRVLAVALDTKGSNRDIDRMAREGDFDWSLLQQMLKDLFATPLRKYIDADFSKLMMSHLDHFQKNYVELLSAVPLDTLNREQALPLLITHFFTYYSAGVFYAIANEAEALALLNMIIFADNPISAVLSYFDNDNETSIAKIAYPSTTGPDKTGREMLQRWAQAKQLPGLASIKLLTNALKKNGFEPHKLRHLPRCLLLARAIYDLEKASPIPIRKIIANHLLHLGQIYDTGSALTEAMIAEGQKFSLLKPAAAKLYTELQRTTEKQVGQQAQIKSDLQAFEHLTQMHDPEGRTSYHIAWMKARWHILSGQLEEALKQYENATEAAFYRAGSQQKELVQETLAVAGKLEKRALLKRLKHRAIVFDLLPPPDNDNLVENWEIEQAKQYYTNLFPLSGRFPEAEPEKEESLLPIPMFDMNEVAKLKPNLRKPNQVVTWRMESGHVRRHPQLRLFASFGRHVEVRALLEHGADVNQLDEADGSALLCALQQANDLGNRSTLDLLLAVPHNTHTLNQATIKKGYTPLQIAIEYGEPDVVEKLLAMGADSELRFGVVEKVSPLYDCVGKFAFITKPQWAREFYLNKMLSEPDAALKETYRRYSGGITGLFGDKPEHLMRDPKNRQIMEEVMGVMHRQKHQNYTIEKLTRITELLLKYKAQSNARHKYPEPGRTPLMLAAESDAMEAFTLMLDAGGDPYQKDDAEQDCLSIAIGFESRRVLDFMRAKGILS